VFAQHSPRRYWWRDFIGFPDILVNAIIAIKQEISVEGAKTDGKHFLGNIR
jgi:hypothetical protein